MVKHGAAEALHLKVGITMLACLFLLTGCSTSQQTLAPLDFPVAAFVDRFVENGDFSGFVAISRSGNTIHESAHGFADYEALATIGPETSFHIASISKTMTAAAISALASDGTLSFDDPMARFLPDFPHAQAITIRHLLAHQSGVADYWTATDVTAFSRQSVDLHELVDWLARRPLNFEPGSRSEYSNSGYALLAAIVEKASGVDFHTFLERRVYPAAKLTQTSAFRLDADARGYQPSHRAMGIEPPAHYDPSMLVGAGSLKSTSADLIRWCEAFIDDLNKSGSDTDLYGWGTRGDDGRRWVEQTGRNPGYAAHIRAYPDVQLCIVVLSNIESDAVRTIGAGLAQAALGKAPNVPPRRTRVTLSQETLETLVGRFQIYPGNHVEIQLRDRRLLLQGQNGPFLPLEPIGDDLFFYRQLYVEIGVIRNSAGAVESLLWGGSYLMPRIHSD